MKLFWKTDNDSHIVTMKTVYFLTYPFILLQFRDGILLLQSSENFSIYPLLWKWIMVETVTVLLCEWVGGGGGGGGGGGIQNDSTRNSFPHQCRPSLKRPTRPIHHCLLLHFLSDYSHCKKLQLSSPSHPQPEWQHNCGPWIPGNATPKRLPVSHSSTLSVSKFNKATLLPLFTTINHIHW